MYATLLQVAIVVAAVAAASLAHAQIAVSVNDNKVVNVNGVNTFVKNPPPDTLTVIDLKAQPPKAVAEINVPCSVVGPPTNVALTPDEGLALVTQSTKNDPNDDKKQVPGTGLSVVDLKASPPALIATVETGLGPGGVSINRQGNLSLVANRDEGTVSVYTISGKTVTPVSKVKVGDAKSVLGHVAISRDGKLALVPRSAENKVAVLTIDGTTVKLSDREINTGLRPTSIDISSNGAFAAVANIGMGGGDEDTVSLIDLTQKPPRVVDTITVGQTPEGIRIAPDGLHIAVVVMNGSNKPKESPFYHDTGYLVMLRVDGMKLSKLAQAPIGHWSQGVVFSPDGKTVLVGNMVEKDVQVLEWDGTFLRDTGTRIKVNGGSAGLRTVEK